MRTIILKIIHNAKLVIYSINIFAILSCLLSLHIKADDSSSSDWRTDSLPQLQVRFSECLESPESISFNSGTSQLDLTKSGQWIPTGNKVKAGKLIRLNWKADNVQVTNNVKKYLVLYRIDPRFLVPQIFIQTYDYDQEKYISDFHKYEDGIFTTYQSTPNDNSTWNMRINRYVNYFNFQNRLKINVNAGDVINITLTNAGNFFNSRGAFTQELDESIGHDNQAPNDNRSRLSSIYTSSTVGADNKLVYISASSWCNLLKDVTTTSNLICNNYVYNYTEEIIYSNKDYIFDALVGKLSEPKFAAIADTLSRCPDRDPNITKQISKDLSELCFYDRGRGMQISVGEKLIKESSASFIHSDFLDKDFIYYKADTSGTLDLTTDLEIDNMFVSLPQNIINWAEGDESTIASYISTNRTGYDARMKFLHFGRYIMTIEIGNGDGEILNSDQSAMRVEYTISDTMPDINKQGISVSQNYRDNASKDGLLWVRVLNPNSNIQGTIDLSYISYIGSAIFSSIIYDKLIMPLKARFQSLSELIYKKFVSNPIVQRIAKLMLTLYVALYGLYFVAGAVKITLEDLLTRVIKITLIVILFSETSWSFFNENFFQMFSQGADYLLTNIVGDTSSVTNVFGFVDPVFDKYTNGRIWALLSIQLLQIHNGLSFLAVMTIFSLIIFFRAVLEVVIGYCTAFIGLAVVISLAPIFITLMLFERTKGIFNNWTSLLFDYVMQPTILLVFFLLIDQIMDAQLTTVVTKACWECLIPLELNLNLRHIGIPLDFSFKLPFLDCIPFYVTYVKEPSSAKEVLDYKGSFAAIATTSLLFYCYTMMSSGLVSYVSLIISKLTNVVQARRQSSDKNPESINESIMDNIKNVTTKPLGSAISTIRDKSTNQSYQATSKLDGERKNYGSKVSTGSRLDANKNNLTKKSDDNAKI